MPQTMTMYCIDGSMKSIEIAAVNDRLAQLQEAVGGFVEVIALPGNRYLVVNEDGKMLNLPINVAATQLAADAGRLARGDFIVGNALLVPASAMN